MNCLSLVLWLTWEFESLGPVKSGRGADFLGFV